MISVTGPTTAQPGTTVYFIGSGFASGSTVSADASFLEDSLPVVLTQKANGSYQACIAIPAGLKGGLEINFGDGKSVGTGSVWVS